MKKYLILFILCFALPVFANPPDSKDVFQFSAKQSNNTLKLFWHIKPGFFLYKDKIQITSTTNSNVKLATYKLPKAILNHNNHQVYRNTLSLNIEVLGLEPGEDIITVKYQGCSDTGICYPPESQLVKLTINKDLLLEKVSLDKPIEEKISKPINAYNQKLFAHHWSIVLLIFFGLGLLLAFTPCVLPMIPVLSGIIVGHGKKISANKAFFLSLSYVLGMSITYALVGAIIATMGKNLQIIMQSDVVIILFSLLFVILALSMFDLYEIKLPLSWQNKLAQNTRIKRSNSYISAFVMGSLSILIISPCVSAPLIGVLSYIAQSGKVFLGALILFFLGLGMGTPLLLFGTWAGKLLPKAGSWMNGVKVFFGLILLALAIHLLERVLPGFITMILWGGLFIFTGLYMGAFNTSKRNIEKFYQGIGILLLAYGILILIGASIGNTNPLIPLKIENQSSTIAASYKVTSLSAVQKIMQQNVDEKPIIIDFYADWCVSCKKMEISVFRDPRIVALLNDFLVITVDVSKNNKESQEILKYFNVVAPPTFLFYNSVGAELQNFRRAGEIKNQEFIDLLMEFLANN